MTAHNPAPRTVTIRYFAWVREKTGIGEEQIALPEKIATAGELVRWMAERGPEFASAFAKPNAIRVAIDRTHVQSDAKIGAAREIAFFPPVTGG